TISPRKISAGNAGHRSRRSISATGGVTTMSRRVDGGARGRTARGGGGQGALNPVDHPANLTISARHGARAFAVREKDERDTPARERSRPGERREAHVPRSS